eukprot:2150593-Rhodomonas_salina.4
MTPICEEWRGGKEGGVSEGDASMGMREEEREGEWEGGRERGKQRKASGRERENERGMEGGRESGRGMLSESRMKFSPRRRRGSSSVVPEGKERPPGFESAPCGCSVPSVPCAKSSVGNGEKGAESGFAVPRQEGLMGRELTRPKLLARTLLSTLLRGSPFSRPVGGRQHYEHLKRRSQINP